MVWLQFALCALIILFAGTRVSHYGELIAEKSGFSKGWIGLVLLAVTTSLSQLVTSLSAVVLHALPNMAVSGLIGSCMFNAMLIGLLDLISKDSPVSHKVHAGHLLSVGFGVVLMGFVAIDILFGSHLPVLTFVHSMDPITIMIVPVYILAMTLTYKFEKARLQEYTLEVAQSKVKTPSWPVLIGLFGACALAIIVASFYLPALAEKIEAITGWGQSFIGTSFIAITTCLPELAVSFSAARRGSFDMAVASLLGSNLCYIVILAITDFCYMKEPLLRHVSSMNTLVALTAMIAMGILVIGLTYRSEKKLLFIAGDAVALIFLYAFANVLLFISH